MSRSTQGSNLYFLSTSKVLLVRFFFTIKRRNLTSNFSMQPFSLLICSKTIKGLSFSIPYRRCRGCRKRRNVRSNSFFEEFPRVPLGKLLQKVHFFSAEDSQRRISRLLDLNASLISKISRHLQDGCPRDSGQANHALWWTWDCGKMR